MLVVSSALVPVEPWQGVLPLGDGGRVCFWMESTTVAMHLVG